MSKIRNLIFNKGIAWAFAVFSFVITVVPEVWFGCYKLLKDRSDAENIIINRLLVLVSIILVAEVIYYAYEKKRRTVSLTGKNYAIKVEYGDLFDVKEGKIVVDFDECYSTTIGDLPWEIKKSSVCGQYLGMETISDIQSLIDTHNIKPSKGKSEFRNQTRYSPGTIIPNGRFLLMAYTKLDKNGLSHMTYDDYLDCLNCLWRQIDTYHGTDDVYMPILGSRITRFDRDLSQQELLDIMIGSYCLSPNRMKAPYTLHIVCRPREGFSLGRVKGID